VQCLGLVSWPTPSIANHLEQLTGTYQEQNIALSKAHNALVQGACDYSELTTQPSKLKQHTKSVACVKHHWSNLQLEGNEALLPPGEVSAEAASGCNKYMYYVCQVLGGPFTLLDDVSPAQIRGAQRICKLLTGELDAAVPSCPPFPGKERHFLRAQIARIGHATTLCPKSRFVSPEEDEGDIAENEEYKPLVPTRMLSPANWCHRCKFQ
jgi:hypothetical protein